RLTAAMREIARIDCAGQVAGSSARMAQVLYMIWDAERNKDDKEKFKEKLENLTHAIELLRGLPRERPPCSKIRLAEGRIYELQQKRALARDELQQKRALAREKYQEALDLGERSPNLIRRLVELYTEEQQYREAGAVLSKLPEGAERTDGFLE